MKRFGWRSLVISSVLLAGLALAQTRPQYGGTLHMSARSSGNSLEPAEDSFAQRNLTALLFDTLVTLDRNGHVQSALAESWQASHENQRWQLKLRRDVQFQDGLPLTVESVAASLRMVNPTWKISADGESVVIERESADVEMLAELALPRNAIWKKGSDNLPTGTGPFRVADRQAGKKLLLAANENYWGGRPYLDSIEIELGKSFRDQMMALEMGKSDLVEVAPEQLRRASLEGRQVASSEPMELVALVFTRDAPTPEEKALRDALSLSIDRDSMRNVLLQGAGQLAGSLLPNWMTGYGFVFSSKADVAQAKHERDQVRTIPAWTLGYDSRDSIDRLLAERIALNAKDAGLSLQPTTNGTADVRLVRIPFASVDPWINLTQIAEAIGLAPPKSPGSVEELYSAEQGLLSTNRIIPLFHLPVSYAISPALKGWMVQSDGTLSLDNAWLGVRQP